ncbi:MAG: LysM peptidoglycan-binding domain-containing protein, partial [Butyrivibrio sp.]|nr:LysM peptidoglycan-binding domain-containing protein [Butyrivibrio sp.]
MSEAMRVVNRTYNRDFYESRSEVRIRNNRARRQRIFRRQVFLLSLITAFIIFMIIFMASTVMTKAQSDDYKPDFKYYKTVTVHTGDNLWDIASLDYTGDHYKNMNAYISEIRSINRIGDADRINAGEELIIPYYS